MHKDFSTNGEYNSKERDIEALRASLLLETLKNEKADFNKIDDIVGQLEELMPLEYDSRHTEKHKEEFFNSVQEKHRIELFGKIKDVERLKKSRSPSFKFKRAISVVVITVTMLMLTSGIAHAFGFNFLKLFGKLGDGKNRVSVTSNMESQIPDVQQIEEVSYPDLESAIAELDVVPKLPTYIPNDMPINQVMLTKISPSFYNLEFSIIDDSNTVLLFIYIQYRSTSNSHSFSGSLAYSTDYTTVSQHYAHNNIIDLQTDGVNNLASWTDDSMLYKIVTILDMTELAKIIDSFE